MMQIKTKLHLLPLFLMSFLGSFFLINIHQVMAASNGHANNGGAKEA
ncbi:MAG: SVM family protein [Pigeon pea little leaf phytoplasma]|nr:SVM family protein [Pigeon pea little leaf phytoplasma]MDV3158408.1 SVM family protein [Pigeon pea little leaf phytoplasma]MDV3158905.1 SVM family protein [Pigeon pea little leaf phytoplasma]MDV3161794.1 SVM family protein [Pigeon pea little leaf phytoplasma]MDV3164649.1 SVM family protein [Pigeon pea little leaf phytoplasma]